MLVITRGYFYYARIWYTHFPKLMILQAGPVEVCCWSSAVYQIIPAITFFKKGYIHTLNLSKFDMEPQTVVEKQLIVRLDTFFFNRFHVRS